MKKRYLKNWMAALCCFLAATAVSAQNAETQNETLTQVVTYYGDWQGTDTQGNTPTKIKHHYYDGQNHLVATAELVPVLVDSETTYEEEIPGTQLPERFTQYHYNENGQLTKVTERIYKVNDGYFRAWTDAQEIESYSYGEDGKPARKVTTSRTYEYKWEGENLVEETTISVNGNWIVTATFSDFLEGHTNCPKTVLKTGLYSNNQVVGEYVYDGRGRVLSYTEYAHANPVTDENGRVIKADKGEPVEKTEYTYQGSLMTLQLNSYWDTNTQSYIPKSKTEHAQVADGVKSTSYNYNSVKQTWAKGGTPFVTTKADYNGKYAPTDFNLTYVDGGINHFSLNCTAPEAAAGAVWKVFRNGVEIGTAAVDGTAVTFEEKGIKNGDYTYFIQCVPAENLGGLNVTTPINVTMATPLAGVNNIRFAQKEQQIEGEGLNALVYNVVEVSWEKPTTELEVLGYNIYTDVKYYHTNPTPVNGPEPITDTKYELRWEANDEKAHSIYVEAVYAYGKKRSAAQGFVFDSQTTEAVKAVYSLGHVMGSAGDDFVNKTENYYYDTNGRIIAVYRSSGLLGDDPETAEVEQTGEQVPYYFRIYDYNEAGQLTTVRQRKYGMYSGYDKVWGDYTVARQYEYDAEGRVTRESDLGDTGHDYVYTWDGNNLVKKVEYSVYPTNALYEIMYSDFVPGADNLPRYAVKDSKQTYNQKIFEYTYDEENRLVYTAVFNIAEKGTDTEGNFYATKGTPDYEEKYTYEDGRLVLYEKNKWKTKLEAYAPTNKTEYVKTEMGIRAFAYTCTNDQWTSDGTSKVEAIGDYHQGTAVTDLKIKETAPNKVQLTAKTPKNTFGTPVYNVYRNGVVVGQAKASGNKLTFNEEEVPNGEWVYFIQASDNGLANVGLYSSEPVVYSVNTPLPAVTAIEVLTNGMTDEDRYQLVVAWEAPQHELNLKGYNIYTNIKESTKNPAPDNGVGFFTDPTYTFDWGADTDVEKQIYVETVYSIGKARSEAFTVTLESGKLSGISAVEVPATVCIQGSCLYIDGAYDRLDVYAANGMAVTRANGAQSVDLSALPAGVYVVRLAAGAGAETFKVVKK